MNMTIHPAQPQATTVVMMNLTEAGLSVSNICLMNLQKETQNQRRLNFSNFHQLFVDSSQLLNALPLPNSDNQVAAIKLPTKSKPKKDKSDKEKKRGKKKVSSNY